MGDVLLFSSASKEALEAIHRFLRFQIEEHKRGKGNWKGCGPLRPLLFHYQYQEEGELSGTDGFGPTDDDNVGLSGCNLSTGTVRSVWPQSRQIRVRWQT